MKPSTASPASPLRIVDNLTAANANNTLTLGDGDATGPPSAA